MQVYVVTSGEYSDYRIDAIFSTRELAQEYVDLKEFTDEYETYHIQSWEVDELHPSEFVDLILINGKVYNYKYLEWRIGWLYDEFDHCTQRVIEITKDYVENYFRENDMIFNEDDLTLDDEKINLPIYIVKGVLYNPNKDVMKKIVYDSIAKYKAEKEGL